MLGFSPEDLKLDGSFHPLKVAVRGAAVLTASTRRGYYAPRQPRGPAEDAKEEIRKVMYSRQETRTIPPGLKAGAGHARRGSMFSNNALCPNVVFGFLRDGIRHYNFPIEISIS
jgi:hypothetical protein